jgi:hypothetical protein
MNLRINTWIIVRGRRGSTTRHCSLSSRVEGPMPGFALNVDAILGANLKKLFVQCSRADDARASTS